MGGIAEVAVEPVDPARNYLNRTFRYTIASLVLSRKRGLGGQNYSY
jgi:hypothetical protein